GRDRRVARRLGLGDGGVPRGRELRRAGVPVLQRQRLRPHRLRLRGPGTLVRHEAMTNNGTHTLQTRASPVQQSARKTLTNLYERCPLPTEQLLVNPGLYMRSSVVAKLLYVDELYRKIVRVPGVIMEFG